MNWMRQIFRRNGLTGELSEETRQHLEEKVQLLVAEVMPREEAMRAAGGQHRSHAGAACGVERDAGPPHSSQRTA
jgi:hypothetical protein